MEKNFGTYPQYPKAWYANRGRKYNEDLEDRQPGAPRRLTMELDDSGSGENEVPNDVYDLSTYPDWYQPKLQADPKSELPALSPPERTQPSFPDVDLSEVVCQTTDSSPIFEDCVHAIGFIEDPSDWQKSARSKTTAEYWWSGVSYINRALGVSNR
jgi:hypothetical protein